MSSISLEVTYRHGKAIAAYLYLPRQKDDQAESSRRVGGLVADLTRDGRLIGVEFASARNINLDQLDHLLAEYRLPAVDRREFAPLVAA